MVTLIGGESIGYFLIIEFKDTETTILHQVLSVIRGCAEMKKNKIDLPDETTFSGLSILPDQRRILVEGKEIYLTHHEFDMILFLARSCQCLCKGHVYDQQYQTKAEKLHR